MDGGGVGDEEYRTLAGWVGGWVGWVGVWGWMGKVGEVKAGRVHPSSPIGQSQNKSRAALKPEVDRIPPRPWGL